MSMPSYSKGDIVLVRVPFSDLSDAKVRPAVTVSAPHKSQDVFVSPHYKQDRRIRDERLEGRRSQRNVSDKARPLYDSSKPNYQNGW